MKPNGVPRSVIRVQKVTEEPRFETVYEARDRLYRALALTIGDRQLAAEAVDEAMTRAFDRWDTISGYDSPEGWVYRVALNWTRSKLKKRRSEDLWREPPLPGVADTHPDPDLRSAVSDLPIKYRSVVVARYLLDWSTSQTAVALDLPESTVKTRLRRALTRLARELGEPDEND